MVVYCPITDKLDLGHAGDGFEVGMEDGCFGGLGFVVTVSIGFGCRVKGLGSR